MILISLPTVITTIFLLIILSYYILLLIPRKKSQPQEKFSSITVVIPAHNEERYIADSIRSVLAARFDGKKEIIVVDDGSKDKTAEIASKFKEVKLIRTKHSGKADSLNKALKIAKGDVIAVVDGDSTINKDSLTHMIKEVSRKNVAAACCPVRVKNRKKHILLWVHIEQLYNSLMRFILSKINANVTTPGPLSIYRKKDLNEVGGFSTAGFSEDQDITIRLIRKGHKVEFNSKAIAETNMPDDAKGFLRQRTRFARGLINLLKRHLSINRTIIDIYTLPLFLFSYIQAIIMGSFTIYQIVSGYLTYFISKGIVLNLSVLKFFFEWFSIVGFVKWTASVITGSTPLTFVAIVGIVSTLLSYPLYLYAIIKFDKRIDLWHIIPIFFMAPFWWFIMLIYILCLPEIFIKKQYNIWKKNE